MEQYVLESFLSEIDVADVQSEATNRSTKRQKRRARASKPSPSWKRRKEELQQLRGESHALGTHLAFLGLARTHNAMMSAAFGVSQAQLKWAIAAKTEKLQCQESRKENERLKAKLRHCTQICASIRERLTQNSSCAALLRVNYQLPVSMCELDMLESKVDARLDKLASIIEETLVQTPETDTDQVQVRRMSETDTTEALELKGTRLVPFDAKKTSETIWSVMKLGVASDANCIRIIKSSKTTRASEGCLTESLECGGSVKIRTRCVMRRVPIPDGFLVLVEAVTEWQARPNGSNEWHHVTRDSGLAVVYPIDVASDGSTTPRVCQIKTSLCLQTSDRADITSSPSLLSRAVSGVVVPSFRKILLSRHQLMDNRLLDSSLGGRDPSETALRLAWVSLEQRTLDLFLCGMDVADFASGSPQLSSSSVVKRPASMALSVAKKPNLSWKRRKEELHRLRAETQALETRVMFLKLRKTQDTLMKAGVGLSEEQKQLREDAVNERQKCLSAQEENTQLKERLERCYKACSELQTVLSVAGIKQHNLIVANRFAVKALQAQRNQSLVQLSSTVLSNLQNRLHERFVELDYFIQDIRASMAGPDIDEVNVHREGFEGTFASVEFKRKRLVPFDAENTSRVIWNVMHLGAVPDEHCAHVTKFSHDTLVSQGCETQTLSCGGTVDLRVSCIMKRIVVTGGFIVLIESTTEWQAHPAQAKAWTHVTRDSGWAVVQPNGARPGTCQLQLAVRLRTEDTEENGPTLLTPVVSDVVIPMFGEVLRARHQLVENALLDSVRTAEQR